MQIEIFTGGLMECHFCVRGSQWQSPPTPNTSPVIQWMLPLWRVVGRDAPSLSSLNVSWEQLFSLAQLSSTLLTRTSYKIQLISLSGGVLS